MKPKLPSTLELLTDPHPFKPKRDFQGRYYLPASKAKAATTDEALIGEIARYHIGKCFESVCEGELLFDQALDHAFSALRTAPSGFGIERFFIESQERAYNACSSIRSARKGRRSKRIPKYFKDWATYLVRLGQKMRSLPVTQPRYGKASAFDWASQVLASQGFSISPSQLYRWYFSKKDMADVFWRHESLGALRVQSKNARQFDEAVHRAREAQLFLEDIMSPKASVLWLALGVAHMTDRLRRDLLGVST